MSTNYSGYEVAIIGMSGRFSDSVDLHDFWEKLKSGTEMVTEFSDESLKDMGVDPELIKNPNFVNTSGVLKDKDKFDPSFFGYTSHEARMMTPSMRIMHEAIWESLEDAGCIPDEYPGKIGLYLASSSSAYWESLMNFSLDQEYFAGFSASTFTVKDQTAARISYNLNLKGPSLVIDTACSSSLVTVHLACQAILAGECDMSVAGGVYISLNRDKGYIYQEGDIYSPDGHCRAFDATAAGTAKGEGVGVVVLKSLDKAIADGDNIYAVIRGTAVNNDGRMKVGYTSSSLSGQSDVIRNALLASDIQNPEDITYVEAHGTGTNMGDPIEIHALTKAFDTNKKQFCRIGSVKPNIGHPIHAAGIAGLIKTALSLNYRVIPPTINYSQPNPNIDFKNSPFVVNDSLTEWKGHFPLRAGVSSFGIGGTNAHAVLEEAPDRNLSMDNQSNTNCLFVLSAKTEDALDGQIKKLKKFIETNPEIPINHASYTSQVGRKAFDHRTFFVAENSEQLTQQLQTLPFGKNKINRGSKPLCVFLFPGQGSQYTDMALGLYQEWKYFRDIMDECFQIYYDLTGTNIKEILFPGIEQSDSRIHQTLNTQPIIFIIEYCIAKFLIELGIQPDIMIGHSIGEYACASISGVISLQDAISLIISRAELQGSVSQGSMLSVQTDAESIKEFLSGNICLASINTPMNCVVSGPTAEIDKLRLNLVKRGIPNQIVKTSHAFHSSMMDEIMEDYKARIENITFNNPSIPYVSTLTGRTIQANEVHNPDYWCNHMRHTVMFSDALNTIFEMEATSRLFIEVGPGRTLNSFVKQHTFVSDSNTNKTIQTLRHPMEQLPDEQNFLKSIGKIWQYGIPIQWESLHDEAMYKVSLPTYAFQKQQFEINNKQIEQSVTRIMADLQKQNSKKKSNISEGFYLPTWRQKPVLKHSSSFDTVVEEKTILLFEVDDSLTVDIIKRLRETFTVITVSQNNHFVKKDQYRYSINIEDYQQYIMLMESLSNDGFIVDMVINMWANQSDAHYEEIPTFDQIFKSQYNSFFNLLYGVRAIKKVYKSCSISLINVTIDLENIIGDENIQVQSAPALSALKTLSQEFPTMLVKNIDISSKSDLFLLSDQLYNEFISEIANNEVAYRGKKRYEKDYEQFSVQKTLQSRIRNGGTYIITGGLGSIGSQIAKYLVEKYDANVILTTRKNSQELPKQNNLLGNKKNIHIETVDITNFEDFSQSVNHIEDRFGPVSGVIHAAGKTDGFLFIDSDEANTSYYSDFFNPKIKGLLNLYHIFANKDLDFLLVMSSLSVVAGGITYCAYSAANSFMDYFMQKLSNPNWISVDWGAWLNGTTYREKKNLGRELQEVGIQPEEGLELLERILALPQFPQVIQFAGDLSELTQQWLKVQNYKNEESIKEQAQSFIISVDQENGKKQVEDRIRHIWNELLTIDDIETATSFFDLGGDSLKALSIVDMTNRSFQIDLSLKDFFNAQTIQGMTDLVSELLQNKSGKDQAIMKTVEQMYYDVTSSQKRLYIINQNDPDGLAYNQPLVLELKGNIKHDKLEEAFIQLIRRHESLRTVFNMVDGNIKQMILENFDFKLQYYKVDITSVHDEVSKLIKPFDLKKPPLIRALLLQTDKEKYILAMDIHHIISDLVTTHIIMRDLMNLYYDIPMQPVAIQYKDYASSFFNNSIKQKMDNQRLYWLEKLDGTLPILELPCDFPRPPQRSMRGEVVYFSFTINESQKIRRFVKEQNITLFSLLLSAYSVFLSKMSNVDDLIIGVPVNGRNNKQLANTVGMFINTLPIRLFPNSNKPVTEFIQEVQTNLLSALDNQEYPFDELVDLLCNERDLSRNPIFDTMFNMLSSDFMNNSEQVNDAFEISHYKYHQKTSMFDLSFIVETKENINVRVEYSTDLFLQETIQRMFTCYKKALLGILENVRTTIGEIQIIPDDDQYAICHCFNNIPQELDGTIGSAFSNIASLNSEVTAVVAEGIELTYSQLDSISDNLVGYLSRFELGTQPVLPIFVDRSVYTIVAILAAIKIGAAYLPINPEHPKKRIQKILDQSKARVIINPNPEDCKDEFGIPVIDPRSNFLPLSDSLKYHVINPNQPAYVIFTSGTTGEPKGIVGTHQNVLNLVQGIQSNILTDINEIQHVSLLASYEFDASIQQIFTSLLSGYTLFIASSKEKNSGDALVDFYNRNQIHVSDATPVHIRILNQSKQTNLPFLKRILVGGEALPSSLVQHFYQHYKHQEAILVNVYGLSECCVDSTYYPIERESNIYRSIIPIGKPLSNQTIYVMDPNMNLQPIGVYGEIYIGGANVTSGYLRQDKLTKLMFVDNPFHTGKLFKTGDYGKWDTEGNLHFGGRRDGQVKKNGYRIEISEIDASIRTYGLVEDAAIFMKANENTGNPLICAYYTSKQLIDENDLRGYLSEQIPYYMIPDHFIRLDEFPITSNGKLDYKALPDPDDFQQNDDTNEIPIHPNEAILIQLWREAIGNDSIDRNTGFFQIGGNSINMIQIISGLIKYGLKVSMRDFYLYNTIKQLAPHITRINNIEIKPAEGDIPLTPIQCRFFNLHEGDNTHFNQSVILQLDKGIKLKNIQSVLPVLLNQHDTLRITFDLHPGISIKQMYNPSKGITPLFTYRIEQGQNVDEAIVNITKEVQQKVNLGEDLLYAMAYITSPLEDFLFITVHHLLIDKVSWHFFLKDLNLLLSQDIQGKELILERKSHTYKQWAELLLEYGRSDDFSNEIKYWTKLDEKVRAQCSPDQYVNACEAELQNQSISLSTDHTNALLVDANEAYQTTIEELLLSAFALSIQDVLGRNQLIISLEGHGRQDLFERYDFTKTMGWFTVIFPFELNSVEKLDLSEQISSVKNNLRSIPNKGIGYGLYQYLLNPLEEEKVIEPDIGFQYLGVLDGKNERFTHFTLSDIRVYNDRSPETNAEYNLLITSFIRDGVLRINLDYNNNNFSSYVIHELGEYFLYHITNVIKHCIEKKGQGHLNEDFDFKELPNNILDDMIQKMNIEK
ncbi:type I polyketide synthase [Heyndrickxia sporothermodurans]|uniref:type I polyketide synthase n=2 Tax=Heyndrickxia sporothermodurans TaxID=46224 RepID=UPI0035DE9518